MSEAKFEQWCVVELFGHQMLAGKVTEQQIGGQAFIRVDVPQTDENPSFTKFYGSGAVYAMTPTGEDGPRADRSTPDQYLYPGALPTARWRSGRGAGVKTVYEQAVQWAKDNKASVVTILSGIHEGEHGAISGKVNKRRDGFALELIMLDCEHGNKKAWMKSQLVPMP